MNAKEKILKVISVLRKNLVKTVIIISVITGAVIIYSFIMPETYEASATILPPTDREAPGLSSFLQSLSSGLPLVGGTATNRLQIYKEMLLSRETAKFIIDSLGLLKRKEFEGMSYGDLLGMVQGLLDAHITRTGILRLSVELQTGFFPSGSEKQEIAKLSADIVNTAIKSLDYLNREILSFRAKRKREFIEKVLSENLRKLDSVDTVIEEFQKENKVLGLDKQTQSIIASAVNIGTELAKAEIELQTKLLEYDASSPVIQVLREKVNSLRRQYQRAQSGGLTSEDGFSIPLSEVPALVRTYTNLLREQKILEQVILYLETQRYQEAIQEQNDVPTVEVLDKAQPPTRRVAPNRKLMIVLSLFLSIVIVPAVILFVEYYKGNLVFDDKGTENI